MIPHTETVTIQDTGGPVTVDAFVGRHATGTPQPEGGAGIVNVDRLLIMADPGTLPAGLTVGPTGTAQLEYAGALWEPVTTLITRNVHGVPHHDTVTVQRAVSS